MSVPLGFPRDRLVPDVTPAEAFRPPDPVDRRIGARARLAYRLAERRDVEHAPAIGDNMTAFIHGAGVEDLDLLDLLRLVEAGDDRTFLIEARIAARRHHHGERRVGEPTHTETLEH